MFYNLGPSIVLPCDDLTSLNIIYHDNRLSSPENRCHKLACRCCLLAYIWQVSLDVSTPCFPLLTQAQNDGPMSHNVSTWVTSLSIKKKKKKSEMRRKRAKNSRRYSAWSTFNLVSIFLELILPKVCSYERHQTKRTELSQNLSLQNYLSLQY